MYVVSSFLCSEEEGGSKKPITKKLALSRRHKASSEALWFF
jgi:hypothetical protein